MRITFLLTQSLESPSGLGRYWPVAKELQRLGHRVTILALHHDYASAKQRRTVSEGVEVWYVGQMHVRKVGNEKLYFGPLALMWVVLRATIGLLWAALTTPTDVYHVGKPQPMNGIAGLLASKLRQKPLFLDCDDYEAGSNRFGAPWQQSIVAFVEDHLPRWTSGITVNTRFTQMRLEQLGYPTGRIVYIPNGVDRARFSVADPTLVDSLRDQLDMRDKRVILYVGSLSLTNHAVDLLVEAFAALQGTSEHVVLLLVGGGEDYGRLQEQVRSKGIEGDVCFVGRVAPELVPLYYCLADMVVDPVHDDLAAQARSPLKIVEAWASERPVVTGDVGDRRFMLEDGALGLLVEPGSSARLAEALGLLLDDRARREAIVRRVRRARDRWYWDQLVGRFASVYDLAPVQMR